MRIAVAQLDPTVGDFRGNLEKLLDAAREAGAGGADLVVASELAITGYPPRDLLNNTSFIRDALEATRLLKDQLRGPALVVGSIVSPKGDPLQVDNRLSNGALLLKDGEILSCHRKLLLPSYDVFDETRYFTPGEKPTVVEYMGIKLGLTVCEDVWNDADYWREQLYERDPAQETCALGCDILINVSASPYDRQKPAIRREMLTALSRRHGRPVLYVNQVGGNDSLIFDGRSMATDAQGKVTLRAPAFKDAVLLGDLAGGELRGLVDEGPQCWEADVLDALCLGLRDYMHKCGFSKAVLGLSGGIDSALCCAIAVRALGPGNVLGVSMPSRYSSQGSRDDAVELAERLGIRVDTLPIEGIFSAYLSALEPPFAGLSRDVTEENLQARIRGALLMAYSNKLGCMLLTTGNKSELAVGYSTLYGDMCGGLAVISDLYKTQVYALARYMNQSTFPPIPESSITKPPSAELAEGQTDQDSLPPYERLDPLLEDYVDNLFGPRDLVARGHDPDLVHRVVRMVQTAEYKRRQMPPGLKVSRKAFGEGRRLPIAQSFTGS